MRSVHREMFGTKSTMLGSAAVLTGLAIAAPATGAAGDYVISGQKIGTYRVGAAFVEARSRLGGPYSETQSGTQCIARWPTGVTIANSVAIRTRYEDSYRPTNLVIDETGRLTGYMIENVVRDPDNGRFTRTIANRLWQRLLGRGIVHPVDVMANRPWSEDLLDHLASYLADNGHDVDREHDAVAASPMLAAAPSEATAANAAGTPAPRDAAEPTRQMMPPRADPLAALKALSDAERIALFT